MTKSARLMFLGLLVMLAGAILLYSLATAIPAGTSGTINPLVQAYYQDESCTYFSGGGISCSGLTDAEKQAQLMSIIQEGEWWAFVLVLTGLILGIVGCFLRDSRAQPAQPAQPATPGLPASPALPSSTP
jgi:hypothetical protein